MPKMIASLVEISIDVNKASKALDKEFREILLEGTREWLREIASIVPSWSGMSRASLLPVADLVDYPLFASPQPGVPDRSAQGEAQGFADLKIKGFQYYFYWETNVAHFAFNEFNNANNYGFRLRNPGPYHSLRKAQKAFFAYVNPRLKKLNFSLRGHMTSRKRVISG